MNDDDDDITDDLLIYDTNTSKKDVENGIGLFFLLLKFVKWIYIIFGIGLFVFIIYCCSV